MGRTDDAALSNDDAALSRARDGDLDAFEVLVVRYTPAAHRTAVLFGAGDDAEDIVQEAFVKAFRALGRFHLGQPFRPWLLQIVVNETRNLHRSRQRRAGLALRVAALTPDPMHDPVHADVPEGEAVARERRVAILGAIRSLPDKDQQVITCRYLMDLSESETAEVLGWPRGSVKSRLSRALRRLQAVLPARLGEPEVMPGD